MSTLSKLNGREVTYTQDSPLGSAMRRIQRFCGPAFGRLLALKWIYDDSPKYASTDGRTLRLNPDGLRMINRTSDPVGYLSFLLVHEAHHALLNHGVRLHKLENKETAEKAADYVINAMISEINASAMAEHRLKFVPFPILDGCLLDPEISTNRSVKEVYSFLEFRDLNEDDPDEDTDDEGEGDSQDEETDGEEGDGGNGEAGSKGDKEGEGEGESKSSESGEGEADDSEDEGEPLPDKSTSLEDDNKMLDDFVGTGEPDVDKPEATDEEKEEGKTDADIEQEIEQENEKVMLTESLDEQVKSGTSGSTSLRSLTAERGAAEPMRWDQYLTDWLTGYCSDGWNQPINRPVYCATDLVCAGRGTRTLGKVVVAVDLSGSITPTALAKIMGSIEDSMEMCRPITTMIVGFSHKICEVVEVDQYDPIPTTLKGGGGTLFQPIWDWVDENAEDADGVIVLTDMYAADFLNCRDTGPNIPCLFVSYGLTHKQADAFKDRTGNDLKRYGEMVEVQLT